MIGVVAMNPVGCIGEAGRLPWHHPEDLQFFKRTTPGGTLWARRLLQPPLWMVVSTPWTRPCGGLSTP